MISTNLNIAINTRDTGLHRSSGVHLSGILKAMGEKMGLLERHNIESDIGYAAVNVAPEQVQNHPGLMRACLGHAWEAWMSKQVAVTYPTFVPQPFELELDDVYMTPDGISFGDDGEIFLHEFKFTMKNAKPVVEEQLWMWQVAGYLSALSVKFNEKVTNVIMHPVYPMGNRKGGIDTVYLPQLVTFEWEEVAAAWQEILNHKHLAVEEEYEGR